MSDPSEEQEDIIDVDDGDLVFIQQHHELVLNNNWWLPAYLSISIFALIANFLFLFTVALNRKSTNLKTFTTATTLVIATLDILDISRILPVLFKRFFENNTYRQVYCSLGVFHELAVALLLISISVAVAVQISRDTQYTNNTRTSVAHKVIIPVVLLVAAGAAGPFFLMSFDRLSHSCTDPLRIADLVQSPKVPEYWYSSAVAAVTHIIPILIIPISLTVACFKSCFLGLCCKNRFKQHIGELILAIAICSIYLGTLIWVVLPGIFQLLNYDQLGFQFVPLLWELVNNAARPICYFFFNPAVWTGLKAMCCRNQKKHRFQSDEDEETELALSPVTTV